MQRLFFVAAILAVLLTGIVGCGGGGGSDFATPPSSDQSEFEVAGATRATNGSLQIPAAPVLALRGSDAISGNFELLSADGQKISCQSWQDRDPISQGRQVVVQPKFDYSLSRLLAGQTYQLLRGGQAVGPQLVVYADGRIGPSLPDSGLIFHYPLNGMLFHPGEWDGSILVTFRQEGTISPQFLLNGPVALIGDETRSVNTSGDKTTLRRQVKEVALGNYLAILETGVTDRWSWQVQNWDQINPAPQFFASTNNGDFVEFNVRAGYQGLPTDGVVVQVGGTNAWHEAKCLTGSTDKSWIYPQKISSQAVAYQAVATEESYIWWYTNLVPGSIWEFSDHYTQYSDPLFRVSIGNQKLPGWIAPEIYARGWSDSAPFDRDVSVPTDATIRVRKGVWQGDQNLVLRQAGQDVAVTKTSAATEWVLQPVSPLNPKTEYQIIIDNPFTWVANFTTRP